MTIDLFTAALMTAIACNAAGVAFIVETLLRRDEGPGRLWSVAYLAGMATTVAYTMWAAGGGGAVSVALGSGLFVAAIGCMWLGSRNVNGRGLRLPAVAVVAAASVVGGITATVGPGDGDWAGTVPGGLAVVAFAGLAAVETLRRPLGRFRSGWPLAVVLAAVAAFCAARLIAYVLIGPDSRLFDVLFGAVTSSIVTIVLTIVAVVVTSVLRASVAALRSPLPDTTGQVAHDGVVPHGTFVAALGDVVERAGWRNDLVGVIAVRIEDLRQISGAFGADVGSEIEHACRQGVRRFAPANALVGEDERDGLVVVIVPGTAAEARRQAASIYRGLFDTLGAITGAVIPVVGVGVSLSDGVGYAPLELIRHARLAAVRAAQHPETTVVFAPALTDDAAAPAAQGE